MTPQEPRRRPTHDQDDKDHNTPSSSRAAKISLAAGIALFLFLMAIPYLNGL